jgi:hypothetical protein
MVLGLLVVKHDSCQRIACRSTSDRAFLGQTAIDITSEVEDRYTGLRFSSKSTQVGAR